VTGITLRRQDWTYLLLEQLNARRRTRGFPRLLGAHGKDYSDEQDAILQHVWTAQLSLPGV
jgi:hypothetical protein